ncbi:MAG: hypothetical protein IKP65_08025 [Alphaproteobacteria bacterium]|nr:hypothetical protein [Alphaproteobacteria bacterium]
MNNKDSHNISFATFFGKNEHSSGYSGLSVDFNTLVENEINNFTVNGNTVSVDGSNLSVILPNSTAIGVDKASGNWVINGTITDHRARGIDGNVSFDELSDDQRRQLSFQNIVVNTISPGEKAIAEVIDNTSEESEFEPLNRTLSLSIPKGDRGDVLWADFMIDEYGMLNMMVSEDYHGLNFTVS